MVLNDSNVGLAFGLTCAAGFASVIGGVLACFIKSQDRRYLSGCLALSAGVMLFVSFVEVFPEGTHLLTVGPDLEEDFAFMINVGIFFAGCSLCLAIDILSSYLVQRKCRRAQQSPLSAGEEVPGVSAISSDESTTSQDAEEQGEIEAGKEEISEEVPVAPESDEIEHESKLHLMATAIMTAGALALHNFPEGIVVFLATVEDPSIGLPLVVAIGVHNIPEGTAVALPVLEATGSKKQALFYTFVSAVAEPVGGMLAWLILGDILTDTAIGVMLSLTAGIMTYVAVIKLQRDAIKHDPSNWSTGGFLIGMAVMAISLVLFRIP
ncbi:Zinc transporter [Perkinsus chesapeaki]|uniref:Zinc transporter n=1 Tax=Perkinsus chesapeaki TaxID=330153 RepID=A0A7J6N1B0_PERCH|nr:Zinc transporter [Perkinsus chesapeaki]